MTVDPELLAIMQCPASGGELRDDGDSLLCLDCGLRYPVRNGIPIMLVEEAIQADGDESG